MVDEKYTLKDTEFKYAVLKGAESEEVFSEGRIMLVGGAATQLVTSDTPQLYRPTTDVDVIVDKATCKAERRTWASHVVSRMLGEGHSVAGGLTRYGAGVRFQGLDTDLLLHLDCFGPNYFDRHGRRILEEYERAETNPVRHQTPMDIITNKLRRMHSLRTNAQLRPNSYENGIISLLMDGQFDEIDVDDLDNSLRDLMRARDRNVEELGRLGYRAIIGTVNYYKLKKDLYDISSIISASRKMNRPIPVEDFRAALKLALVE